MASDIIKFRKTKEFEETMFRAKQLIVTDNQSDLIRILMNLGLERLEDSFKAIKSVTHPLKMSETRAIASSIKIYLLKEKEVQIKDLRL